MFQSLLDFPDGVLKNPDRSVIVDQVEQLFLRCQAEHQVDQVYFVHMEQV